MRSLALLLLVASVAHAQDEEKPRPPATWSITAGPIRLIYPIFEVDLEYRIAEAVGVTVVFAGGKTKLDTVDQKVTTYEVGAQLGYYLVGNFDRGLSLSLEVLYVKLDTPNLMSERAGAG